MPVDDVLRQKFALEALTTADAVRDLDRRADHLASLCDPFSRENADMLVILRTYSTFLIAALKQLADALKGDNRTAD
jgi:hypothetical protein